MEIKDNIIEFCEYKRARQEEKERELEGMRYALFMSQHVDDDTFTNENEFDFTDRED